MKRNVSKRDLTRLSEGEIPLPMENVPFAVIRYSVRIPGISRVSWEWELLLSGSENDSIPIDRSTARSIIASHRMELAHAEDCGQVYDLPGRPFREANRKKERIAS